MANPRLSRLAAKLFNQYKVPMDKGYSWAIEIENAESESDLSPELQKFLSEPYFIKQKPENISKSENKVQ